MQEVRNAVDQANREATTRFDFKGTDSTIELTDKELILSSATEDRLRALYQVLQEKLVRREVSLKSFDVGKIEEASRGSARQRLTIQAGISSDHAKKINKFIKVLGLKGVSSQTQGDQLRVTGKKRDDLQSVINAFRCSSTTSGTDRLTRLGPPGSACPPGRRALRRSGRALSARLPHRGPEEGCHQHGQHQRGSGAQRVVQAQERYRAHHDQGPDEQFGGVPDQEVPPEVAEAHDPPGHQRPRPARGFPLSHGRLLRHRRHS
jgi:uncharacterized protein YajQ (UPF0234 family)